MNWETFFYVWYAPCIIVWYEMCAYDTHCVSSYDTQYVPMIRTVHHRMTHRVYVWYALCIIVWHTLRIIVWHTLCITVWHTLCDTLSVSPYDTQFVTRSSHDTQSAYLWHTLDVISWCRSAPLFSKQTRTSPGKAVCAKAAACDDSQHAGKSFPVLCKYSCFYVYYCIDIPVFMCILI